MPVQFILFLKPQEHYLQDADFIEVNLVINPPSL